MNSHARHGHCYLLYFTGEETETEAPTLSGHQGSATEVFPDPTSSTTKSTLLPYFSCIDLEMLLLVWVLKDLRSDKIHYLKTRICKLLSTSINTLGPVPDSNIQSYREKDSSLP